MLNSKYFELIKEYETTPRSGVWRPKYDQAILSSAHDGTPIAAFGIKEWGNDANNVVAIAPRPNLKNGGQKFQVIFAKPKVPATFIVTNLLSGGSLCLSLNWSDKEGENIQLRSINEINVVKALNTLEVRADLTKGNTQIIIEEVKETVGGVVKTVKLEKEESGSESRGSYVSVILHPQTTIEENLFKKTVWNCDELITIPARSGLRFRGGGTGQPSDDEVERAVSQPCGYGARFSSLRSPPPQTRGVTRGVTRSSPMPGLFAFGRSRGVMRGGPVDTDGADAPGEINEVYDAKTEEVEEVDGLGESTSRHARSQLTSDIVLNSNVARVVSGEKVVINSTSSADEFNWTCGSGLCIFGISTSGELKFVEHGSESEIMQKKADELIEKDRVSKVASLLEDRTYDQDECYICREEGPDTISFKCGHKALHYNCLTTSINCCGICRTRITAFLKLSIEQANSDVSPDVVAITHQTRA